MEFTEPDLIDLILAFVQERGEVTASDIQITFGTVGTLCAGWITARGLLMIVGGGGPESYRLQLVPPVPARTRVRPGP